MSTMTASWNLLRRALLADGVLSGATGALGLIAAVPLGSLLGLEVTLLRVAGLGLLPFAAFLVYLALQENPSRRFVWGIVGVNLLWVIDSILLLVAGWAEPTLLGYLFTGVQAAAVAVFAGLEYLGLRRSAPALSAA